MGSTAKPVLSCEVAWSSYPRGVQVFDVSTFDGADTFGVSPFDTSFDGTYDDLSSLLASFDFTRGGDGATEQAAGTGQVVVRDPLSRLNASNPASPLYGILEDRLHPLRIRARGPVLAALTLSGNEITDATRLAGVQGDGRAAPDTSYGIWEGTTNLVTNGGFETNTVGWSSTLCTLSRDTSRAKFGTASLHSVATSAGGLEFGFTSIAGLVVGTSYTLSGWVWIPTGFVPQVRLDVANLAGATGTITANADMAKRDQWQRVVVGPFQAVAGDVNFEAAWRTTGSAAPIGSELWFDGMQVEAKPIATPYVHTNGATASRVAARVQAPASLLTTSQGWVAMRVRMGWPSTTTFGSSPVFWEWQDDANNRIVFDYSQSVDQWRIARVSGGTFQARNSATQVFNAGDVLTLIAAWDAGNVKVSVNGGAFLSAAAALSPSLTAALADIGSAGSGALMSDSDFLWFGCGTGPLTNADAAKVHQLAVDGDAGPHDLPAAAACTATWDAIDGLYTAPGATLRGIHYAFATRITPTPNKRRPTATIETIDLHYWLQRGRDGEGGPTPTIGATGPTTVGAAIGLILDAVGWIDPAARVLDTGGAIPTFSADGTKTALELIAELLEADRGLFYINGAGQAVYHDRYRRHTAASVGTISDTMVDLSSQIDTEKVHNAAKVTATNGTGPQTATDQTSINKFGRSDWADITSRFLNGDTDALALAQELVRVGKSLRPPVEDVTIDSRTARTLAHLLARDLDDLVTLRERQTGTLVDAFVESVQIAWDGLRLKGVYGLSRKPTPVASRFDISAFDATDIFVR